MKKFLVVLLSLGLVMAFSMSALAVTPDFTGQYYARGSHMSNPTMLEKVNGEDTSFSYADQRLRMFFRLRIVDGLTLSTRMDALETMWGRDQFTTRGLNDVTTAKTAREHNSPNLSFEQVWATFKTGIGTFNVGYQSGTPYTWGTRFLNAPGTAPGIVWTNTFGNFDVVANWSKTLKGDFSAGGTLVSATPNNLEVDADRDYYNLGGKFKFKGGDAGLLLTNFRYADTSGAAAATSRYKTDVYVLDPYVRMKFGPVDLESEAYYGFGKRKTEGGNTRQDIDHQMMGVYVNAKYNMGPAYVGGMFVYMTGNDLTKGATTASPELGAISGFGYSNETDLWGEVTPTILFGYGYHGLGLPDGNVPGSANDPGSNMDNTTLFKLFGGYGFTKKLGVDFKLSYAKANEDGAATGWQSKDFGTELDVKLSYKIYDRLTYNVGAAYLWTGDYFKGTSATAKVSNIYYLTHYIDLTF